MAKNPKNQPPNDDQPGNNSDDSLPPWLRGDAPPPPDPEPPKQSASKSSLPKLSPRKSDDPDDSVPPWLRGLDAPESKNVLIGGKEVPREFFDDADSLADAFDTDQSYDDWLEAQNEERREKSVEEEIPDIFAGLGPENDPEPASPSAYPTPQVPGTTGQLPDWFLGLEELDDSEAPDWFKQMGTGPLAESEPPPPNKPEPAKADPIVDFFQNLGMDVDAEEDDSLGLDVPGSSFFHNLVGKEAPPEPPRRATPSRPPSSDDEDDVPDFGSVTGNLKSTPDFLQDDEDDNIFASQTGGVTRRLDDENDDIFASPPGGVTRNLDFEDYQTPATPIQGGQTMRFDMQDDAPPAPAAGGQTIRFDDYDDDPFDAPATPIQGGQTIRFDLQDEEKLVPTDELDAFLEGIGEATPATTPKPPSAVEIPQYELDAFLEGIEPPKPAHNTQEMSSIEDPDLDFFMEAESAYPDPEPELKLESFEPYELEESELDTGSLSFLNELDNIVANASRGAEPTAERDEADETQRVARGQEYDDPDLDEAGNVVAAAPPPPRDSAPTGDFDWGAYDAAPAQTSEQPAEQEEDWLSSIGEEDAPYEQTTARIPSPEEMGLTGLLNRGKKKEQPPPENYEGAGQSPAGNTELPQDDFDLNSLYASNVEETDAGLGGWQIPDSLSSGDASAELSDDLEDWERVVRGGSSGYEAPSAGFADDDDDLFTNFNVDDPLEAELQSGWLNDDVLNDAAFEQPGGTAGQATSAQDDFNLFDLSDVSLDDEPGQAAAQIPAAAQDDFNLFDLSDVSLDDEPGQPAAAVQEDNFSFLDLADTPLEAGELPASTEGTDVDFFSMLERNEAANILPRTSALTSPPAPVIENESETLNFDELEPAMAEPPESGFDDPDLFSFFDDDEDEPAAATPPTSSASAPESDTIDFGKWDQPQASQPADSEPETEGDSIDFGKWDQPEAQTEGDSNAFSEWDRPQASQPADSEPETEGDSIDFGKWDTPQNIPEEWDESIGFDNWDMQGTGDLDPLTSEAPVQPKATSDFDTVDFENLELSSLQTPDTDVPEWSTPPAQSRPRDESGAIDFSSPSMPGMDELDRYAFDQSRPDAAQDADAGFDIPDKFAFLGEVETPPLRPPSAEPSAPERKNESETIAFDDQGQPIASEPQEEWSFDVDDPDIFSFLGEAEATPPLPTPPAPTPTERKYESDTIDLESLGPEAYAQAMAGYSTPSDTDPHKTIATRDEAIDRGPEPEYDAANAEEAVTDNFFESFGLNDDSQQTRDTLDDLEVEDIFASLDSEPLIADDDTQPQEITFDLADAPNAQPSESDLNALFSTWEASQPDQAEDEVPVAADEESLDALFTNWDESPTQMTVDATPSQQSAYAQGQDDALEADDELFDSWAAARSGTVDEEEKPETVEPFDLFGDWTTEDIAPIETPADPLEGWDSDAPPPLEVPTTFTEKRATSSLPAIVLPDDEEEPDLFAEWGMDQPDPFTDMTGLNEGVNWAEEFNDPPPPKKPGDPKEEDRNSFLENRENRTDSSKSRVGSPAFEDIDTYLASLETDQPQISQQTGVMFNRPDNVDIDALLDQQVGGERDSRRAGYVSPFGGEVDGLEGANPDFLEDISIGVEDVSAGAMVRQKQDRPVEELPERLRKLRERSAKLQAEPQADTSDDSLSDILPGVDVGLSQATFTTGVPTLDRSLNVTPEQQTRVNLLQSLVGGIAEPKRMSAIDMTYDTPFMEDFQDDEENIVFPPSGTQETAAAVAARPRTRRGLRLHIQPDRLLIVALLAAAVIAPFLIPALRFGDPPPADFSADPAAAVAFAAIDTLGRNDLALVALEYAPASSGELDTMTDAVLRHILLRGASPVIIGGNPVTLLRAEDFMDEMNADADFITSIGVSQPLEQNYEYFVARFLPGGVIGLRAFSADTAALLTSDIRGQTTNLFIDDLDDFDVVVVITDSGETLRSYAEQVAPLTDSPLVAGSTYGAAPLVEPYARSGSVHGLLSGYADALTYAGLLDSVEAVQRGERRIVTPPPTLIPPTPDASAPGTDDTSGSGGAGVEATDEVTGEVITEVAPEATTTGPGVPGLPTAVINASQRVNLRMGPGAGFAVIRGVEPGSRVTLLDSSDDGEWAQVRLEDGTEGWMNVDAALLTIEAGGALPKRDPKRVPVEQIPDVEATNTPARTRTPSPPTATVTPSPTNTDTTARTPSGASVTQEQPDEPIEADASATTTPSRTPSPTPRPTSTAEPTTAPTEEPTEEATAEAAAPPSTPTPLVLSAGLQSERWYGINMGIIVTVLIISAGAIGNIIRSLLRGRRNR